SKNHPWLCMCIPRVRESDVIKIMNNVKIKALAKKNTEYLILKYEFSRKHCVRKRGVALQTRIR
ncbi:MAG: hypothetical protein MJA83_19580, partial [Gammaproteobacteria bacterium]|nr:hypothetical protein [Gammaproteobacteria bacterium]